MDEGMHQTCTRLIIMTLAVSWAVACSSGDTVEADFKYLTDYYQDNQQYNPDIPTHVFDQVADLPSDFVSEFTKTVDGEVMQDPDLGTEVDIAPDLFQSDGKCIPQCEFADGTEEQCGPDGCDSICGYCDYGYQCIEGLCEEYCPPQCEGKQCGPDGCYGECPPGCEPGFICGEDGLCYPFCDHDANCEGKQCGPDGCDGSCGACGIGSLCNEESGQCEPHPCGDIPEGKGKCTDDNILMECINNEIVETPCQSLGEDFYCKWDGPNQKFVCSEGCVPICLFPDGTPKECGDDGCYGVCGNCSEGWACEAGFCYPQEGAECGWIPEAGYCEENKLWFCNNDILYLDDCGANGMNCSFDTNDGKFKCK